MTQKLPVGSGEMATPTSSPTGGGTTSTSPRGVLLLVATLLEHAASWRAASNPLPTAPNSIGC
jgi:hypothetical protein